MASASVKLTEQDIDEFNEALSLIFIASSIEQPISVDEAIHVRNVCRVATQKLCSIRNRISTDGGVEV